MIQLMNLKYTIHGLGLAVLLAPAASSAQDAIKPLGKPMAAERLDDRLTGDRLAAHPEQDEHVEQTAPKQRKAVFRKRSTREYRQERLDQERTKKTKNVIASQP
jgi:hypothetical protein